jgi:hypothetical protein
MSFPLILPIPILNQDLFTSLRDIPIDGCYSQ